MASDEKADIEDLHYHWIKVKHFARCLENRGYDVNVGGLLSVTSTDLEVKKHI